MVSLLHWFQWFERTGIGVAIRESTWLFPAIEAVHLLALALIGGAVLIVDLRLFGWGVRRIPVKELRSSTQGPTSECPGTTTRTAASVARAATATAAAEPQAPSIVPLRPPASAARKMLHPSPSRSMGGRSENEIARAGPLAFATTPLVGTIIPY